MDSIYGRSWNPTLYHKNVYYLLKKNNYLMSGYTHVVIIITHNKLELF